MIKTKNKMIRSRQTASEIIEKLGFADYPVHWETVEEIVKDDLIANDRNVDFKEFFETDRKCIHYIHYHWGFIMQEK